MTATHMIETTRFGALEFTTEDVVEFSDGLVGFPDVKRFVLIQHKEGSPYRWLQSLDLGDLAFLVVDPAVYVSEYAPDMPRSFADSLQMQEDTPRLVYTIVTIPRGRPEEMTLNLAGPIVINLATQRAAQIVLEDDRFPIRFSVFQSGASGDEAA
ncbi:MAG: flagellar assembly protein FliW [Armatimonadetes bacterium]|nr:flagellar assembly protein FliW [Armatimonadota bacterium]